MRDYLTSREGELWRWFASARSQADYTESLRLDLLKFAYRLEAESHPELRRAADEAKAGLGLDIPVTLYQAQNNPQPNAALYFIPGEGHVVFTGPVLALLSPAELKAVIGHELAHYRLWDWERGEMLVARRLIEASALDPRAAPSHEQTARRFQLYTEIYADRGALRVSGDLEAVVGGLVKIETGLAQASGAAYLRQAEEIFEKSDASTKGISHPEAYIRARALALWRERGAEADPEIARMIEGATSLDELDVLGQVRLEAKTRMALEQFLRPKWAQTPAMLGHAKMFFGDFQPATEARTIGRDELELADPKTRDYFCYLLLDFATADRELEETPLAAALAQCEQWEIDAQFEKIAAKELKMRLKDVRKLKEEAAELLSKAEGQHE